MRSLELRAELAAALERASCPRSVHTFLGRFAAYASAPTPVPPSQWFGRDIAEMKAASKDDIDEMLRLLFEAYNDVVTSLEERRFVATPLPEDEEAVREWCEGYFEAACTDDVWMSDPEAVNLLSGIAVLAGERNARGEEPSETLLAECRENLYIFAAGFHEHFADARRAAAEEIAQQRGDADTYRRGEPKVGRNAPCPCGSGKKYKRCCGNPAMVH